MDSSSSLQNIEGLPETPNESNHLSTEVPCDNPVEENKAKDSDVLTNVQTIATETNVDNQTENSENLLSSVEVNPTDKQVNVDKDSSNSENTQQRKTILSDLMEMSGISAEDGISDTTNFCPLPPNIIPVTRRPEVPPTVINENISISGPFTNLLSFEATNPTNRLLNYIGHVRPELNAVTSFLELKYAYENDGQFYKLDTETGIIAPINVCIKKTDKPQGSTEPKTIIDLTEDGDDVICTDSEPNSNSVRHDVTFHIPPQSKSTNVTQVKPIKLFKSVRPSILHHSGKSLLTGKICAQKTYRTKKHTRKQILKLDNRVVLQPNNEPVTISQITKPPEEPPTMSVSLVTYDSSDEEPLAKKSKRIKPADENDEYDAPEYLELQSSDDEIYGMPEVPEIAEDMDTNNMDIEGVNPELNPVAFEEGSESEEDMCILGV